MKDQQPSGPWTTPRLGDDGVQVAPLPADCDPRVAMRAVDLQPVPGPGVANRAAIAGLEAGRAGPGIEVMGLSALSHRPGVGVQIDVRQPQGPMSLPPREEMP